MFLRTEVPAMLSCDHRMLHNYSESSSNRTGIWSTHLLFDLFDRGRVTLRNYVQGRELSHISNKRWRQLFLREFGEERTRKIEVGMKQARAMFKWREAYEVCPSLPLFHV